ncbi:DUF3867 domain-containing protein [Clostridium sp.]|uniref:DUF3867 domain-containing protein n=1 Tax=Clostridium sp. TaxID=1506 RepID=UPI0032163320
MSDVIDFNELKNKATDKDVDKFEDYIYSMYYSMAQGKLSMAEMSREIFKYMKENNISQEKFMNIQKKVMERYGISTEDVEGQMKSMGIETPLSGLGNEYEEARKIIGFQEKYKGKLKVKSVNAYSIKNDKNDIEIMLQEENVILKSYGKIDLADNELNEFLCSYKKVMNNKMLNISICENASTYLY